MQEHNSNLETNAKCFKKKTEERERERERKLIEGAVCMPEGVALVTVSHAR